MRSTGSPPPPEVTAIHVSPAARLTMQARTSAHIHTGGGIVGDRYEHARHRQVSVQSQEELDEAAAILGVAIEPSMTRRNLTLGHGHPPTEPGSRFLIGTIQLEVVRIAAPCRLLDDEIGPGARRALRRRAGVICRTLAGGTLHLGDRFALL